MLKTNKNFYNVRLLSKDFGTLENDTINLILIKEKKDNIKILYTENYQSYYIAIEMFNKILETKSYLNSLIIDEKTVIKKAFDFVPLEPNCYIYFLLVEAKIIYIGQTTNLLSRIASHQKDKIFDHIACFKTSKNDLLTIETVNIQFHKPKLNKSFIDYNLEFLRLTLKYTKF